MIGGLEVGAVGIRLHRHVARRRHVPCALQAHLLQEAREVGLGDPGLEVPVGYIPPLLAEVAGPVLVDDPAPLDLEVRVERT
eukprot:513140-Heterocapsa_arctica.AAC.1